MVRSLSRVPARAYTLTVTNGHTRRGRPLEIAEIPVEVTDTSIAGIKVTTVRGARVSGRLEWAGGGPVPWPRNAKLGRIRATAVGRELISPHSTPRLKPMERFDSAICTA
jgi:hypothetical protein